MRENIYIIVAVLGIVAGFLLCARGCEQPEVRTITVRDTTTVVVRDTLRIAKVPTDSLRAIKELRLRLAVWQQRARAIEDSLARYRDTYLTCEQRAQHLEQRLREEMAVASELLEMFNKECTTLNTYEGSDSTETYKLRWRLNVFGQLAPEGFAYSVDTYAQQVTRTVTRYEALPHRHQLNVLAGYDGAGGVGIQYTYWRRNWGAGVQLWRGQYTAAAATIGFSW